MPKRSQEHMAERRQQILDAAMRCFCERGFHRTSITDICKAAGLSVGAVYIHFKNKRAITVALANKTVEFAGGLEFQTLPEFREYLLETLRALDHADRTAHVKVDFQLFQLSLHDKKLGQQARAALPGIEQMALRTLQTFKERGEVAAEYDIVNGARLLGSVMNAVWLSKAIDPQSKAAPYQSCISIEFERMAPAVRTGRRKTAAA